MILVLSDVHLGDIYSRRDEFFKFLSIILELRISGKIPLLRAIVILGDFFDLVWSTIANLVWNREFTEIYDDLQAINNRGVEIMIALGNLKIPAGGFYNIAFEDRKKSFLEKLEVNGFNYNF